MSQDFFQLLANPFVALFHRLIEQIPAISAAFLFLIFGLFFARVIRTLIERGFSKMKLDELAGKVGVNEILARMGLGKSPSFAVAFLIYWFILLAFFASAANALNLTVVAELLDRFMSFLPSLVAAIVIVFVGLMVARFLSDVVTNAAHANNIRGGSVLGRCASAAVITFAALMALEQLDVHMSIIASSVQILFASLGLAFGLAFGLGGKELAGEFLREVFNRKKSQ